MPPDESPNPTTPPSVQEERTKYGEDKPRAKDTARLIWASKPRKEPNPKDLEFQNAEEVYPNVADIRDKKLSAFATNGRKIAESPNRLIWGDNLLVMQALLAQGYEGQIDLIYIDPPFNTGENFNFNNEVRIGEETYEKDLPINERLAYTDTWSRGFDSFLDMIYPRLQLMRKLLSEKGSIYVHCDYHVNSYLRLILDEIFGQDMFCNEIIWKRSLPHNDPKKFGAIHDSILYYRKTDKFVFNQEFTGLSDDYIASHYNNIDENGKRYQLTSLAASGSGPSRKFGDRTISPPKGNHWRYSQEKIDELLGIGRIVFTSTGNPRYKRYLEEMKGPAVQTIWDDILPVNSQAIERIDYPTQKPEALLERIIKASSNDGDLVADFFCGSGTTGATAEKLRRRWIQSDVSKTSIQVTRSRLVNQNSTPFVIENLGNYQRQLIYAKEVNLRQMYAIVLKLYGAEPRPDMQGFGISKENKSTFVYVSQPDRAMTARKAADLARLAKTTDGKGYRNLVILAWDYDYDFDDALNKLTKGKERELVKPECKIIPSDVYKYLRSTKVGDPELAKKITFYQKPYIRIGEPEIKRGDGNTFSVRIRIEQYVIMDIPVKDESKRPEIEKCLAKNFAYLIDYWTVDWDYNNEVFRSEWQAIRDRRGDQPVPVIAEKILEKGKKYTIAVRVVDVFGNDAAGTKEIDLR
ncbi:MAG: site-specific DNA-methyltransferase [Methanoregulaceae archaeon]|jgi:adenine-specific DNA-methyltransferase